MKVGDHIVLSSSVVSVYELSSDLGLIVGRKPTSKDYPDDYYVLVDGDVIHMGFAIEESNNSEVISETK